MIVDDNCQDNTDEALIDNLARAHHVLGLLKSGQDYVAISQQTGLSIGRMKQLLRMAYLAPDIVRDIVQGRQPPELTSEWLQRQELPIAWSEQGDRVKLLS